MKLHILRTISKFCISFLPIKLSYESDHDFSNPQSSKLVLVVIHKIKSVSTNKTLNPFEERSRTELNVCDDMTRPASRRILNLHRAPRERTVVLSLI